jgi:hypothetical protein
MARPCPVDSRRGLRHVQLSRQAMADPMAKPDEVRQPFRDQAAYCGRLGSPFMQRLCSLFAERLAGSNAVFAHVLQWPGDPQPSHDSVPLRLCGALHWLVLAGKDAGLAQVYPPNLASDEALWLAVEAAVQAHAAPIVTRLQSSPQTNEVRRSAVLLPGFLEIARRFPGRPLVASELGASAGLNMNWDRYRYRLGAFAWGDADASVVLTPEWRGADLSEQHAELTVAERAACDLNPLDGQSPDDRLRLLSYLWADQAERLTLTRAAMQTLDRHPVQVDRADAIAWLQRRLAVPRPDSVHVVYHSICWQYFSRDEQAAGETLLRTVGARATERAPVAWLRFEEDGAGPGAGLWLTTWPGGLDQNLARADHHGRWVHWRGDDQPGR